MKKEQEAGSPDLGRRGVLVGVGAAAAAASGALATPTAQAKGPTEGRTPMPGDPGYADLEDVIFISLEKHSLKDPVKTEAFTKLVKDAYEAVRHDKPPCSQGAIASHLWIRVIP